MTRFTMEKAPIDGLKVIQRLSFEDERGYLERMFCSDEFSPIIENRRIVQINRTLTANLGTIRGMHFQLPPYAEMKLVSCIRGEVFDVAVDLRRNSSTFLNWHAEYLSEENNRTFVIPEGFAHGFQTLSNDCELIYFHTAAYNQKAEGGIDALDERINIVWPLPILERSMRDQRHPALAPDFAGIVI